MEELTDKQLDILKQFRSVVSDILLPKHDDHFLVKWLIARKFVIQEAEAMLRKSVAWRKQFKADSMINYKTAQVLENYWTIRITSHDNEGCPVLFLRYGCIDIRGIFQCVKKADVIKFSVKILETVVKDCEEQTKKLGKYIGKLFTLIDMENFSLQQFLYKPSFDYSIQILSILDSNYPELLKKVMIINAPAPFSIAYSLVKPFLHERTINKIQIFGKDGWQGLLLSHISPPDLPAFWGGTRRDANGDPCCSSEVCPGGPVPKSYFMTTNKELTDANSETLVVPYKSVCSVEVHVPKKESLLIWEFQTQKHDIGFGIFLKESNEKETEEIIPVERVDSNIIPEKGKLICKKTGMYILKFDNTFSMLRSKTVKYNVKVKPPST